MRFAAPGTVRLEDSPPVATDNAPITGAATRISGQQRLRIAPRLWPRRLSFGIDPAHPYVRTYWTVAVGSGAVVDLLRLIAAAEREASIPQPLFLPVLCMEGLVQYHNRSVWVRPVVPPLGQQHLGRLTPTLRRRHREDVLAARASSWKGGRSPETGG